MWPGDYGGSMLPHFMGARATASNVSLPEEQGGYTTEMFREDFPQFTKKPVLEEGGRREIESLVPEKMLNQFIRQANDSVLPSRWGSMWQYAAGLYVAHLAAMYLKTYAPGSDGPGQAAGGADQTGMVKSASMGDTTISYDNSAVAAGTEKWGTWNATQYGAQLVTMARMAGIGGMYVV